jgi:hypothetical protein
MNVHAREFVARGEKVPDESISIGMVLNELVTEFRDNPSPQTEINAENVLKITLSSLNSRDKISEISLLRKLLYSELGEWSFDDISKLNNTFVQKTKIGDYHDKSKTYSGFGNVVRNKIQEKLGHSGDKRIMLLGWMNICKLIKGEDAKDVEAILKNISSMKTPSISMVDKKKLNDTFPRAEKITGLSIVKYIYCLISKLNHGERSEKLKWLKYLIMHRNPGSVFRMGVIRDMNHHLISGIYVDENGDLVIDPNSEYFFWGFTCNVGVVDLMYEHSAVLTTNNKNILTGSLFERLVEYKSHQNKNKSVIKDLIDELHMFLRVYSQRKQEYFKDGGVGAAETSRVIPFVKKFIDERCDKSKKQLYSDFNYGCIVLNIHSDSLEIDMLTIPAAIKSFVWVSLEINEAPVKELHQELLTFFEKSSREHIYSFQPSHFQTLTKDTFDGKPRDSAVFDRYASKSIRTIPYHLDGSQLMNMLAGVGDRMIGFVLAGGMACMMRYNNKGNVLLLNACLNFIHGFSTGLTEKQMIPLRRNKKNVSDADIAASKIHFREYAYKNILNTSREYSNTFGRDTNFQKVINSTFEQLKKNQCVDALRDLCTIDVFFTENLILFGLAVIFRGCVEVHRNGGNTESMFEYLIPDNALETRRINMSTRADSLFRNVETNNEYWNVLSVIIHGWSHEDRFANIHRLGKLMPIFRWEILNLFFRIMADVAPDQINLLPTGIDSGETNATGYFFSNYLKIIDSLLDNLTKLTIE